MKKNLCDIESENLSEMRNSYTTAWYRLQTIRFRFHMIFRPDLQYLIVFFFSQHSAPRNENFQTGDAEHCEIDSSINTASVFLEVFFPISWDRWAYMQIKEQPTSGASL